MPETESRSCKVFTVDRLKKSSENVYLVVKIRVDIAENERSEVQVSVSGVG